MPTIPFTVTVVSTPPIEVFGVNISYEELLNSFGAYFYLIETLFIETRTDRQANEFISFDKYDVNGKKLFQVVAPAIDPYGKQAALYMDLKEYHVVADGQLTMSFNVLPSTWLRYTFYTKRGFLAQLLLGVPNKKLINV